MKNFCRSVNLPSDWKLFVQNRLAQQENQEEELFHEFSAKYESGLLDIAEKMRERGTGEPQEEAHKTPTSENLSFVHRHKITGEVLELKSQIPEKTCFLAPKCVEDYSLEKVLEFVQHLIAISLRSIKGCESLCSVHSLYEHFGSLFEQIYLFLQSPFQVEALDQMVPALKTLITEGIYGVQPCPKAKFFFESLRPMELNWMCGQPQRFLGLVDQENSSSLIAHHLIFFRRLSLIELTYLYFLPDEQWNHFKQILDHKEYQEILPRYHVFAILGIACIIQEKNRIGSEIHPLLEFYRVLKPFCPPWIQRFFEDHAWSNNLLLHTFYGFYYGDIRYWIELQTLRPEQAFIKTLISAEPIPPLLVAIPTQSFQSKHSRLPLLWIPILYQHEMWNDLEKQIERQPEPTFVHPYWREWKQKLIKSLHVQARDLIHEAQINQECITQKNYYPTYYQYWPYFVFGWVIVTLIFVLFVVALVSYSIQKTYPSRYYIRKMKAT